MLGDAELARAAKNGDATSLGVLLERHRAPLYALALRILGHGPQAQDAVQDTFVVALGGIDRLREPEAVEGWLRAITRNVCLMQLRARRQVRLGELDPYLDGVPAEPSAEEAIDRLALREWVWTALSELPEALRATAILRYFGTYQSYEEISAILDLPVGTVKSRLSRVKTRLTEALLETAGLEHDEARLISEYTRRSTTEVFEECNRGYYEGLTSILAEEVMCIVPGREVLRGRDSVSADLTSRMEQDREDGVRMRLENVLASKGVVLIEGAFENPPEDPFHCPPAMVEVHLLRDGLSSTLHRYYAPRTEKRPADDA